MKHLVRKHGGIIMAILGVILMGAFSLPTYFKNAGDSSSVPVGTLNGKTVTSTQVASAKAEISILKMFNVPVASVTQIVNQQNEEAHWYLLLREAEKYGIAPSEADITQQVAALGATDEVLNQALSSHQLTQTDLRLSIAHGLMIRSLIEMTAGGVQVSVPQMEVYADQNASRLLVSYLVLDAQIGVPTGAAASDDAIQKQFDLYKGVIPASISGTTPPEINGHHYPFGYKYADRVMVEYIKFERDWLKQHFKPTNTDFEEAYRYYSTHTSEFSDEKAAGTQPAIKPFDSVSNQLVQQQVDTRIAAFMKKVNESARDLASVPWKDAETDKGLRKSVMDKGAAGLVNYQDVVKAINANPEFEGYKVVYGTHTDWLDKAGLLTLKGIGGAAYKTQTGDSEFADMALHVKELEPADSTMTRLYLQEGVEGPLVTDEDGNVYMYRVIKAEKSHEPASVSEVRGQVAMDLAKIAAYEGKEAQGKQLAADLAKQSMDAVAAKAQLHVQLSDPLRRRDKANLQAQPAPGFIDAAYSMVGGSTTQPANKTALLNDDAGLKVYVMAEPKYSPLKPSEYGEIRPQLMRIAQQAGFYFAMQWLSLDELAKRMKYVPIEPFKEKSEG